MARPRLVNIRRSWRHLRLAFTGPRRLLKLLGYGFSQDTKKLIDIGAIPGTGLNPWNIVFLRQLHALILRNNPLIGRQIRLIPHNDLRDVFFVVLCYLVHPGGDAIEGLAVVDGVHLSSLTLIPE